MDETSVASFYGTSRGNVMNMSPGPLAGVEPFADAEAIQWASRAKRRTCFTHCAFICNVASVQKKLPQLVIVNEKVRLPDYNAILQRRPENVYIKRQKSAWNNEEIMVALVAVLKEHLLDEFAHYEVVLFLDAAKCHTVPRVVSACNRHGILLIILPAKLTWLVQPCDTHLFGIYKSYMRVRWQEIAAVAENGEVDLQALFTIIFDTIENVINARCWRSAFMDDGFHTNFARLSDFIMKRLEYKQKPAINAEQPTQETFALCYPSRSVIPTNLLLKPWRPNPVPALPPPPAPALPALPAPQPSPGPPALPVARPLGPASAHQQSLLARALANAPEPWQTSSQRPQQAQQPQPDQTTSEGLPWRLRSQTSRSSAKK